MKTRIIGLLLIGLLFSSCPEKYYAVHVQNLTDHKIRFYTAIDVVHMYPDTLINPTELGQPVHPNSTGTRGGGGFLGRISLSFYQQTRFPSLFLTSIL